VNEVILLTTFERIKSIFPSVVHRSQDASDALDWYEAHDGTQFGLPKAILSARELQLLSFWAEPIPSPMTAHQQLWQSRLTDATFSFDQPFRLFSLTLQGQEAETFHSFLEILGDFMPHAEIVVVTRRHIEIIEPEPTIDLTEFEDVLRAIASDCFIEATAIYSQRQRGSLASVYHKHQAVIRDGKLSTKAYPASQLLYHSLVRDHTLRRSLFDETIDALDAQTVELLEALFANSLNISNTAKALYLHRNTLNYRLDRLYETSGFDARFFYDAALLQLLVTLHKFD